MLNLTLLLLGTLCQDPGATPQAPDRTEAMPVPRRWLERRDDDRELVVDGSLQDWPAMRSIGLDDPRQLSGTADGAWRDPSDLAARVFMLWDDDSLWLGANVLDDWHVALKDSTPRVSEIPPVDSLLLTIDPKQDTRGIGTSVGREDDLVVWLADVEGQGQRLVIWDRILGGIRMSKGGEVAIRRDQDRRQTFYEMRLPLEEIFGVDIDVEPGLRFDLQIELDDLDEPTDPIAQTRLGWTFGTGAIVDPDIFGTLVLADVSPEFVRESGLEQYAPPKNETQPMPDDLAFQRDPWEDLWQDIRSAATEELPQLEPIVESDRSRAIDRLDDAMGAFPWTDYLLMHHRIHRRMRREVAGLCLRGLPAFWLRITSALQGDLTQEPPEEGVRIIRLPLGGFVVTSKHGSFAVDPAGPAVDRLLEGVVDFILVTEPYDETRRQDQLMKKLITRDSIRRVFMHLPVHVPTIPADRLPIIQKGESTAIGAIRIEALGPGDEAGRVMPTMSYLVRLPDDFEILIAAPDFQESDLRLRDNLDIAFLSARHPRARVVIHRFDAETTIWKDALQCSAGPGNPRVPIEAIRDLAQSIRQHRSLIMAPGDLIEIE
ncbi:MAG: hypothetical protein AAF196_11030 [Planctomycetota bacterium]